MSQKQENRFIDKIKPLVVKTGCYLEKTFNPLRRGTPDLYIEGPTGASWVEVKWIEKPWTEPKDTICPTTSWPLQKKWLTRSHGNGLSTAVVVAVGDGKQGYFLPYPYIFKMHPLVSREELVYHMCKHASLENLRSLFKSDD